MMPEELRLRKYYRHLFMFDIKMDHFQIMTSMGPRKVDTVTIMEMAPADPRKQKAIARGTAVCNPTDEYRVEVGTALALARAWRGLEKHLRQTAYAVMNEAQASRRAHQMAFAGSKKYRAGARAVLHAMRNKTHEARLNKALASGLLRLCPVKEKYYAPYPRPLETDMTGEHFETRKCPHCGEAHYGPKPELEQAAADREVRS